MSTYTIPTVNDYKPKLVDSAYYADIRYDANETAPNYIGLHVTNGASTASTDWKIYNFTRVGGITTRIRLAYGAWDNRVALFP